MAYELFFDGFEHYAAAADLLKYGYFKEPQHFLTTGGRRGGKCIQGAANQSLGKLINPSSHVVVGCAFKADQGSHSIRLNNSSTSHALLTLAPLSPITLSVGGATVATSTQLFPANTWMYVELGCSVADAGGIYEVRVNGSSIGWVPAATGDTKNGSTTTIDRVEIWSATWNHYIDDFYITYGNELKWLGDSRIDKLLLTADATPQDWTPDTGNAWERLNAGTGYIAASVDEATSLFEFADLPYTPQAIHGLAVRVRMLKSNTNFRTACMMIKSGSTESEGAALGLSTDALGQTFVLAQDPATAAAWTYNGIRDALVGVRVKD